MPVQRKLVFTATDENYAPHAAAMIHSAQQYNTDISYFVLVTLISDETRRKFEELREQYNINLTIIDIEEELKYRAITEKSISVAAYSRLYIPNLISEDVDVVLYIDADCIVCSSLDDLFSENIDGVLVLGRHDPSGRASTIVKRKMVPANRYINSGVMLLNIKLWRELSFSDLTLSFSRENEDILDFHDQCAINAKVDGRIRLISADWNFMPGRGERLSSLDDVKIIHFAGVNKPWSGGPGSELYWHHRNMTPFRAPPVEPRNYYRITADTILKMLRFKQGYRRHLLKLIAERFARRELRDFYLSRINAGSRPPARSIPGAF